MRLPALLGRYYTTTGTVIHGDKRGGRLVFQLQISKSDEEYIIPPLVYMQLE